MRFAKPSLLVVRPDFEVATHYIAYHFAMILENYVSDKDITLIDVYGDQAIHEVIWPIIDGQRPNFISFGGHANPAECTAQNYDIIFDKGEVSIKRLSGLSASFLSCSWGQAAKDFVDGGMKGFHGYTEDFYFVGAQYPNSYASPFFRAHLAYSIAICDDHTQKEAFDICLAAWNEEISHMDTMSARYAIADRDCMILEGEPNYKPMVGEEPPPPPPPPPPEKFKCCVCGLEFDTCGQFGEHYLAVHDIPILQVERSWFCQLCDWLFGCPLKD